MAPDNAFDAEIAKGYDAEHLAPGDLAATVDFLARLAGTGSALEFAIGTGRVALPLATRGIDVHGIELSPAMVEQLRTKPGGDRLEVTIGDMAATRLGRSFELVFLVFNTITNLTTQAAQVACFENAARHLAPGGHFVIETFVPPLAQLRPGETRIDFASTATHSGWSEIDIASQTMVSHHEWLRANAVVRRSMTFRYVWPSELDLMARIAGLELVERWADWSRTKFDGSSTGHVSVWRKPAHAPARD